jgi:[ribosomal protein S18]-alanine N-acetyltransferase
MEIDMQTTKRTDVQIRWLIRRDMAEVLAIERQCFGDCWTEDEFLSALREKNCIGMVAEHKQKIVGFMIYELHTEMLDILNFAVAPTYSRQQVGTQMVQKLIDKLSQQRRKWVILEVRETNLSAQLFFRAMGFEAVSVQRHAYEYNDESAYVMRYSIERQAVAFRNRISEFDVA